MIKAIGFDWSGVIYGKSGEAFSKEVANLLGISLEQYRNVYFKHNNKVNIDKIPVEEFWMIILRELKKEDLYKPLISFLQNQKSEINQSVLNTIKSLKKNGYKLGILSNHNHEMGLLIKQSEVAKYMDCILISVDEGVMKPQEEAYVLLANKLSVKLSEMIFIDDIERNLTISKSLGFYGIQFFNIEQLNEDLHDLGVKF